MTWMVRGFVRAYTFAERVLWLDVLLYASLG